MSLGDSRPLAVDPADGDAIRRLVAAASNAQNDPETLVPMHTADAIVVNFVGRRVLGRDSLDTAMRTALASPLAAVSTEVEVVDIRRVTDTVALASCIKTTHDGRSPVDGAALPSATGALTYVVVREQHGWAIALAQTTPTLTR